MTAAVQVVAVVPVKHLDLAKSRLALPPAQRHALALAFVVDTVSAVCRSPLVAGVLVVTSDPVVARALRPLGVRLAPDHGGGLGCAVADGIRAAQGGRRDVGVAVVPADLPCLRPGDVSGVLADALTNGAGFVPDRSGRGTTVVVHPPGCSISNRYGPDSAAAHRALGLRRLEAGARARQDVDTLEDLRAAGTLGLGPRTAAAVEALGDPGTRNAG